MFYFFSRGKTFLRCEIRLQSDGDSYEIAVEEPGQGERVQVYASSDQAHQAWLQLQQDLNQQGWWGPHGRD